MVKYVAGTKQVAAQEYQSSPLSGKTTQQARTWVDNQVTDLASAKATMADMAAMMIVLQTQIDELNSK